MNTRACLLIPALAAAFAMAACSGQSSSSSSTTTTAASPAASPAAATNAPMKSASVSGATVYNTNCSSCHQANGKGLSGQFPPLAGNAVVNGPATAVIHIVKNGLNGPIKVNGVSYNGMMPAWKQLKPAEIAAVITYVRSSWGNHGSAVTEAQVKATK